MPTNLGEVSARKRKAQLLAPIEMTILLVCSIIFLCMFVLLVFDQTGGPDRSASISRSSTRTSSPVSAPSWR